jgi:hypothetical protein
MGFQADLEAIRNRAREHMMQGPVTEAYLADREQVIRVLNDVIATEIVCILRYKRHEFTPTTSARCSRSWTRACPDRSRHRYLCPEATEVLTGPSA